MSNQTKDTQIFIASTEKDIGNCFLVLQELRPKLGDKEAFIAQILRQIQDGYTLAYLYDGKEVGACIGFRNFEMLAWGKVLYIDDLITREKSRKKGFGRKLLDYAIERARHQGCDEVHLDSGHHRYDAHRLYLNMGFKIGSHHLWLTL